MLAEGLIAQTEYEDKQQRFLAEQQKYKDLEMSIADSNSKIINAKNAMELLSINNDESTMIQMENLKNAHRILLEEMKQWEQKYVLKSPIAGILNFHKEIINVNYNLISGEEIFSIIPLETGKLKAKLQAPIDKSGKIQAGQRVNLYLDNFPFQEFGVVQGRVEKISVTPNNNGYYLVHVELPDDLYTTYKKRLEFKPGLQGRGDIVTEEMNLVQRIFQGFLKQLSA